MQVLTEYTFSLKLPYSPVLFDGNLPLQATPTLRQTVRLVDSLDSELFFHFFFSNSRVANMTIAEIHGPSFSIKCEATEKRPCRISRLNLDRKATDMTKSQSTTSQLITNRAKKIKINNAFSSYVLLCIRFAPPHMGQLALRD